MKLNTRSFKLPVYLKALLALLCLAAMCALPSLMVRDGIKGFRQWRYLSVNGVETVGTVLQVGPDPGRGLTAVTYHYEAKNEAGVISRHTAQKYVTRSLAASLTSGQPVVVVYDPAQPANSRLKDDYQFVWNLAFIPEVIVPSVVGVAFRYLISRIRN